MPYSLLLILLFAQPSVDPATYREALRQVMVGSTFQRQPQGWTAPTGAGARFMTQGRWFNTIRSLERYYQAQRQVFSDD